MKTQSDSGRSVDSPAASPAQRPATTLADSPIDMWTHNTQTQHLAFDKGYWSALGQALGRLMGYAPRRIALTLG